MTSHQHFARTASLLYLHATLLTTTQAYRRYFYFEHQGVDEMLAVLSPLYRLLEEGAATASEHAFVSAYGSDLMCALSHCRSLSKYPIPPSTTPHLSPSLYHPTPSSTTPLLPPSTPPHHHLREFSAHGSDVQLQLAWQRFYKVLRELGRELQETISPILSILSYTLLYSLSTHFSPTLTYALLYFPDLSCTLLSALYSPKLSVLAPLESLIAPTFSSLAPHKSCASTILSSSVADNLYSPHGAAGDQDDTRSILYRFSRSLCTQYFRVLSYTISPLHSLACSSFLSLHAVLSCIVLYLLTTPISHVLSPHSFLSSRSSLESVIAPILCLLRLCLLLPHESFYFSFTFFSLLRTRSLLLSCSSTSVTLCSFTLSSSSL